MPYVMPFALMLCAISYVFGQHVWIGWRTGTVRFPMSVFTVEEFDRDESLANFWGVMALDSLAAVAVGTLAIHLLLLPWKPWN